MNLGTQEYYDACVYTSPAGREQLRVAALQAAKAILGYSTVMEQRRKALTFQTALSSTQGALDLCNSVRDVWWLGIEARNAGIVGIEESMTQLEAVAKNIYQGPESGFPWLPVLAFLGLAGGGYYVYRRYGKRSVRSSAAVSGCRSRRCLES